MYHVKHTLYVKVNVHVLSHEREAEEISERFFSRVIGTITLVCSF